MKRLIFLLATCIVFCTCDSGDIYPPDDSAGTYSVKVELLLQSVNTIPTTRERKLLVAAFDNTSEMPVRSQRISTAQESQTFAVTLDKVPDTATKIRLILTGQGANTIFTFAEADVSDGYANLGKVNLLSYDRLQEQLFTPSCIACHSAANPTKGLNLEAGASYAMIVGKPSQTMPELSLIAPYDTTKSYLYHKLMQFDGDGYNHTTLTTLKQNDITLLGEWIMAGAVNQ